jgi:hypothetical protein
MGKQQDWRDRARETYRAAIAELRQRWSSEQTGRLAIFKEELEEALLDLKQAVIDENEDDAELYEHEVKLNLIELRWLSENP